MGYKNIGLKSLQAQFNRHEFEKLANQHCTSPQTRKLSHWQHFWFWIYASVNESPSMRDCVAQLNSHPEKFHHLGFENEFKLSTLSDANTNRTCVLYENIFSKLLLTIKEKHREQFAFPLEIMDATSITSNFIEGDWAAYNSSISGIKVHLVFDVLNDIPLSAEITSGKISDISVARTTHVKPGSFRLIDRGYFDSKYLYNLTNTGVFFAQRLKSNVLYTILSENKIDIGNVRSESTIQFMGENSQKYAEHLRRIEIFDERKNAAFYIITNNFELPAETIAAFYKARWRIEFFFKWIKQHLKISRLLGYSHNAIKIQIWTALIAYLLLWRLRIMAQKTHLTLLDFLRELRGRIFLPIIDSVEMRRTKPHIRDQLEIFSS